MSSAGTSVAYVSESYTPAVTGTSTADGVISITMDVTAFGGDVTINEDGSDIAIGTFNATVVDTIVTAQSLTAVGGVFTIPEGSTQRITLSKLFNSKTGFLTLSVTSVDGSAVPSTVKTMAH